MKILFTGASSFTGFWFVKTLAGAGHEIVCPVTGSLERYEGIRQQRVKTLQSICRLAPDAPFGSDVFLALIRERQFDLLCHHAAAEMANYRSPDFDIHRALAGNTLNLRSVLAALCERGCKGVVLTGSVFENDEGVAQASTPASSSGVPPRVASGGETPLQPAAETAALRWPTQDTRAFSPYGLSKGLTFQVFRFYCAEAGLPLGKFVIPNPFGPFEEPRFTAYLMKTWKNGQAAGVKTPDYVRDNIHADLLAAVYVQFAMRVAASRESLPKINPSGYVETQGQFAERVAREVRARTGWPCDLELGKQTDFSEPLRRVNSEPAASLMPDWNEKSAWDGFVKFYNPSGS